MTGVRLATDTDIAQDVVNTFVQAKSCASSADVLGFCLTLSSPPILVGPKASLSLRTPSSKDIMEATMSLAQATRLTIYFPCSPANRHVLSRLPQTIHRGLASSLPPIGTLYGGKGGRIIRTPGEFLQTRSDEREDTWDVPPAYDQVASSTSAQPGVTKKRSRAALATSDSDEPCPRKRDFKRQDESQSWSLSPGIDLTWKLAVTNQLASLAAQIASMQQASPSRHTQMVDAAARTDAADTASPTSSTCSTVEDSVEDRLALAENTIVALRRDVAMSSATLKNEILDSMQDVVEDAVTHAVHTMSSELDQRCIARFDELDGLTDELNSRQNDVQEETHELLDDMLSGVKLEMRDFIKDEMEEVQDTFADRVKARIRYAASRTVMHVDFEDDDEQ